MSELDMTTLSPEEFLQPGLLANYQVQQSIGVGATAQVYWVRPKSGPREGQDLALKVFFPLIGKDLGTIERIEFEATTLRRLEHPNIVRFFQVVQKDGGVALELELVDGQSLKDWMLEFQSPLLEPRIWILSRIAKGLSFAHEQRVLHRDLKPENVLISKKGEVRLSDFGLAKSLERITVTKSGALMGSLCYMAPEIFAGEAATERTDLFSFAVIAYEILTGTQAFDGPSPQAIMRQIHEGRFERLRVRNPAVPEAVAQVIESCLSVDPKSRPAHIWEVDSVLMSALVASPISAFSQGIVGIETRPADLQKALQVKYQDLNQRIDSALKEGGDLLGLGAEYQRLFPNGDRLNDILQALSGQDTRSPIGVRSKMAWAAMLVILLLGSAGGLWWQSTRGKSGPASESIPAPSLTGDSAPNEVITNSSIQKERGSEDRRKNGLSGKTTTSLNSTSPTTVPARPTDNAISTTKASRQTALDTGLARFDVPSDVEIFVNDKRVPQAERESYVLPAGPHRLRMFKNGFMPIESQILIRSGKTTVVSAGAQ